MDKFTYFLQICYFFHALFAAPYEMMSPSSTSTDSCVFSLHWFWFSSVTGFGLFSRVYLRFVCCSCACPCFLCSSETFHDEMPLRNASAEVVQITPKFLKKNLEGKILAPLAQTFLTRFGHRSSGVLCGPMLAISCFLNLAAIHHPSSFLIFRSVARQTWRRRRCCKTQR